MPVPMEKSELYDHHRHRVLKGVKLYFCKKCVRSYDSKDKKCKFCGETMKLLDEGKTLHYYHCKACDKKIQSLKHLKKCDCGENLTELKKWETMSSRERMDIATSRFSNAAKKVKKKLNKKKK